MKKTDWSVIGQSPAEFDR